MAIEQHHLRRFVIDYLRSNPTGQIGHRGDDFAKDRASKEGLAYTQDDGLLVLDIFHDLYREGLISTGTDPRSVTNAMCWPFYRLTDYGRTVLAAREYVPHDPDGYLASLKKDLPAVDAVIVRYLEEALGCFKAGHMLASAVMLGCAAEKAVLLLVEAFGSALSDPQEQAKYRATVEMAWMISRKYEELWKRLESKLGRLPAALADDLHTLLDRTFDLIRTTRNEAGHPTGKTIDRDAMRANFILFPGYCKRVYALIDCFQRSTL